MAEILAIDFNGTKFNQRAKQRKKLMLRSKPEYFFSTNNKPLKKKYL